MVKVEVAMVEIVVMMVIVMTVLLDVALMMKLFKTSQKPLGMRRVSRESLWRANLATWPDIDP